MKKQFPLSVLLCLLISFSASAVADEGMYPISDIHKLDLKAKGFGLTAEQIFNPEGKSLIDGICNIGGCTGSFVSGNGLILTNHHCAFRAIQSASTRERDCLKNGFIAWNKADEYPAAGYTVRITESYRDVSGEVLGVLKKRMDLAEKAKAIDRKMKEIVKEAEKRNPGKRAEVSEMFTGKTYVLFIYTYLRDIRLVYAPPLAVGNFGGEEDNWMWPRHTGDFSVMRAYTGPDGNPADYSPDNVPYTPRRVLKLAPEGVKEEDFVFILGYPGRTYRHQPASFLSFEQDVRMPFVVSYNEWMIQTMETMGRNDRAIALKHENRIKGLSNTMKNYKGKLLGLKRIGLVSRRLKEDAELQRFIDSDPARKARYGSLLGDIRALYAEMSHAKKHMLMPYLLRSSALLSNAFTVYEASIERQKKDTERESAYMDRNFDRTRLSVRLGLRDYYEPTDKIFFKDMLMKASALQEDKIEALASLDSEEAIDRFIDAAYRESALSHPDTVNTLFDQSTQTLGRSADPFLKLAIALYPSYMQKREADRIREGAMDQLYAGYLDVKKEFLAKDFIPDANGTLRLTFGRIRGYTPADGVYYAPFTTVEGILEKTTSSEPFDTPPDLAGLIQSRTFGRFTSPELKSIPVAMLYDMDTTGGNSGSPVLNARGEMVGINFDRVFEATLNDYAWSEEYSRSIAVDIRYVLWIIQTYSGAEHLIREMNIE